MSLYPQAFRTEVLKFKKQKNLSMQDVAKHYGINPLTVSRWMRNPIVYNKRNRRTKLDMEAFKANILEHPDWPIKQRAEHFSVSTGCIVGAIKRLKIKRIERDDWELGMRLFIYVMED